jgi:hypothetical protein
VKRTIPPWKYETRNGRDVVVLGNTEYVVDTSKPPAFFFPGYLRARLPERWEADQRKSTGSRHPLIDWLDGLDNFLAAFD